MTWKLDDVSKIPVVVWKLDDVFKIPVVVYDSWLVASQ